MKNLLVSITLLTALIGCSHPVSGPDKSFGGAVLGGGWGAGAGAIVGNQVATPGQGAAVGAGIGAVEGLLVGAGMDVTEGAMLDQERKLASIKVQNMATEQELANLQYKLDRAKPIAMQAMVNTVYFDADSTSLRAGTAANLEKVADGLRAAQRAGKITITGHGDDGGTPDYNEKLGESRARTVAAFLIEHGVSNDQITIVSEGSKKPLATNSTPEGRAMNRRVDISVE